MSLKSKIILILFIVLVLYTCVEYLIQSFVIYPSFTKLEQDEAEKNMKRSLEALHREIHHLDLLCNDWATWDDTYRYVQDRNEAYREASLNSESFKISNLNLI